MGQLFGFYLKHIVLENIKHAQEILSIPRTWFIDALMKAIASVIHGMFLLVRD